MQYDLSKIGKRAYNARLNKNISQIELSEAIGISQSACSKFENGVSDLPLLKILMMCEYLGISISWLVDDNNIPRLTDIERLELENYIKFIISKRAK
jgi:transcriptional regulator with XRE-family HTH domain